VSVRSGRRLALAMHKGEAVGRMSAKVVKSRNGPGAATFDQTGSLGRCG
jgi:hypothetical protein